MFPNAVVTSNEPVQSGTYPHCTRSITIDCDNLLERSEGSYIIIILQVREWAVGVGYSLNNIIHNKENVTLSAPSFLT